MPSCLGSCFPLRRSQRVVNQARAAAEAKAAPPPPAPPAPPKGPKSAQQGDRPGYIYLIREREFVKTNEEVYKVGRSKNFERRFQSYPKDSEILGCMFVRDQFYSERMLIQMFDREYKQRSDIGREYYEGDRQRMINDFLTLSMMLHLKG